MQGSVLKQLRMTPLRRLRPAQENVPQTQAQREDLRRLVAEYAQRIKPVPPLAVDELRQHAQQIITQHSLDSKYLHFTAILLNNEAWRESLASVPFDRRLLLLPKCLRAEDKCSASLDELGLVCKQCGQCSIQDIQAEALRLGYAVLVAEGSALVMALVQTGKIDAIVGVSCLPVLEKAFPYVEAAAIPSIAIPLLQRDCRDSGVDLDWVWDAINLSSADSTRRLDLDALRHEVESWFELDALDEILGPAKTDTERLALEWLGKSGKRWRPFLAVCAYKAMQNDLDAPLPEALRRVAIAVECFHKASLVHDDIEDNDSTRYGEKTLHEEHGVPVALNIGDLLLGDGYRLLAECDVEPAVRAQLVRIAAEGHRTLCLGQGAELSWARNPAALSSLEVMEIFRQKTAPAFEVALRLGAALAGAGEDVAQVLARYSESLGIAYQIRDDLEDLSVAEGNDINAMRPALPLALAYEQANESQRPVLEAAWRRAGAMPAEVRRIIGELGIAELCESLLETYKQQAVRCLSQLECTGLKGLLRRVIGKIFNIEFRGWCSECQTGHAPGSEAGAEAPR